MKAKDNLLEVFDELIEADQRSEPRVMIVRLYVGHNLFGNSWPFLRIIVLYYSSDACSQLDSVIKKQFRATSTIMQQCLKYHATARHQNIQFMTVVNCNSELQNDLCKFDKYNVHHIKNSHALLIQKWYSQCVIFLNYYWHYILFPHYVYQRGLMKQNLFIHKS